MKQITHHVLYVNKFDYVLVYGVYCGHVFWLWAEIKQALRLMQLNPAMMQDNCPAHNINTLAKLSHCHVTEDCAVGESAEKEAIANH